MKIVPNEPTEAMIDAGFTELDPYENSKDHVYNSYCAMLAAAPDPCDGCKHHNSEKPYAAWACDKCKRVSADYWESE